MQRARASRLMIVALLTIGAIPLLLMMTLVVSNSVGRVFFNTHIKLTIDGTGLLGVILISTAIGFAERERVNVVVRIVFERIPERARVFVEIFTCIISLAAAAILFWALFTGALNTLAMHEATIAARIPLTPFKFTWAGGVLVLCLFLAQHLIEDIVKAVKGVKP